MTTTTDAAPCVVKNCDRAAPGGLVCQQHARMYEYHRDGMPLADAAALGELTDPTTEETHA